MSTEQTENAVDINLMGREYRVYCPPDEREALNQALAYVHARMQDISTKTQSTGERLAAMTALNLAHELVALKLPGGFDLMEFRRRIEAMQTRLDTAMAQQEKLF